MMYFFSPKLFQTFINEPIFNFLTGKTFYHLYFISVILQFCLIFPLLCQLNKINIFVLTAISLLISLISLNHLYGSNIYFFSDRSFLGNWIFYFFFGILFYKFKSIELKPSIYYIIIIFILFAISFEILSNQLSLDQQDL